MALHPVARAATVLRHVGLRPMRESDGGIVYDVDPDLLEHAGHDACEQPELPWDV